MEDIVQELLTDHMQGVVRELAGESVAEQSVAGQTDATLSQCSSNEDTIERWCLAGQLVPRDAVAEARSTHEEELASWYLLDQSIVLVSPSLRISINTEHRVPLLNWSRVQPLQPPTILVASSASSVPPPPKRTMANMDWNKILPTIQRALVGPQGVQSDAHFAAQILGELVVISTSVDVEWNEQRRRGREALQHDLETLTADLKKKEIIIDMVKWVRGIVERTASTPATKMDYFLDSMDWVVKKLEMPLRGFQDAAELEAFRTELCGHLFQLLAAEGETVGGKFDLVIGLPSADGGFRAVGFNNPTTSASASPSASTTGIDSTLAMLFAAKHLAVDPEDIFFEINIQGPTGEPYKIRTKKSETWATVKAKIHEEHLVPTKNQQLEFEGKVLGDAETVGSVVKGSEGVATITMKHINLMNLTGEGWRAAISAAIEKDLGEDKPDYDGLADHIDKIKAADTLTINLKMPGSPVIVPIQGLESWKTGKLMEVIQDLKGIPKEQQLLEFNGSPLNITDILGSFVSKTPETTMFPEESKEPCILVLLTYQDPRGATSSSSEVKRDYDSVAEMIAEDMKGDGKGGDIQRRIVAEMVEESMPEFVQMMKRMQEIMKGDGKGSGKGSSDQ
jgi:hypothetical protein